MAEKLRTHDDVTIEYYRNHPGEIPLYLEVAFEESKADGDWKAFMIALRHAVQADSGISELAENLDRSRTTLYRTLSENATPRLDSVEAILEQLGCELSIRPKSA